MADVWRKPYHVVIEVENSQCKILKKFAALGIKHVKLADIRSSSSGSVKHLIELDREQVKKIPKGLQNRGAQIFSHFFVVTALFRVYLFSMGTNGLPYCPTYFEEGRRRTASWYCSSTWAVHPDVLLEAKNGVNNAKGTPKAFKVTAA
jgi:hypothetical protein